MTTPDLSTPLPTASAMLPPGHPLAGQPFLDRLIVFLMPYFLSICPDDAQAQAEIIATLDAYGARSRSELLSAARVIALSFAAMDMLAESKATEMSPTMRLRYRTCANSLDRSCQQIEKTLAQSLACDTPDDPAAAGLLDDLPDPAQMQALLRQTQDKIDTTRNRLSGLRPAGVNHPAHHPRTKQPTSAVMAAFDALHSGDQAAAA